MEDPLQKENPKFEKLGRYYLIALCAIAMAIVLSQVLVQKFISDQESDSELVNLSGRQRMLSQKISKSALLMGTLTTQDERASLLDDFQNSLLTWRQSHQWLQKQTNSKTITDLFSQINPLHQEMADAADRIVVALRGRSKISPDIKKNIDTIILYEGRFLEGMDAIVNQFDEEEIGRACVGKECRCRWSPDH